MRIRTLVAAGLGAGLVAASALADDGYRHGRVRFVEPGVTLQRATEGSAEEAIANLPFLPGDRVWTDSGGRAEFQFPDGTVVRLDRRSKLDYAGHDEGKEERIVLRLWSGSALVRVRTRDFARFEIETPAGAVQTLERGIVRVDVQAGEARVSVHAGEAVLDDGRRQVRLAAGERTFARWGGETEEPRRFDPDEDDDFARWDGLRESGDRWAARSAEYLPDELDPYAGEFEANGRWQYEGTAGYVWVPTVGAGWEPYANGYWTWTAYGWTWVPNERWGWAPFHYGRWDYSASFGWYWMPGRTWGPGWVSWGVGGGYVGWCPLGRGDRPVEAWGHGGGYAVSRGRYGRPEAWNVVRQGDLGGRDLSRRRVAVDRIEPGVLRVADSGSLRPTRDGSALREGEAGPRAVSRRMSPGDFVRELGPDNKTTIPAPWTRGYGPPPAGADGARYGVPRRPDQGEAEKPSRTWSTGGERGTAAAPRGGTTSGSSRDSEGNGVSTRAPRAAPWYVPAPSQGTAGAQGGGRVERAEPSSGAGARPRSEGESRSRTGGGDGSSSYRPRDNGGAGSGSDRPHSSSGESSGSYRPRSGGGESGSGGARPRSDGAASRARPDGGGGRSQGSGSGSSRGSGSSGGHAAARPRGNRG
jgi:hypothetical protein